MTKRSKCPGYDEDGNPFACDNPPGTAWTPVWCGPCDENRRNGILVQLQALAHNLNSRRLDAQVGET